MTELRGMNRKNSFELIVNCNSVFKKTSIVYAQFFKRFKYPSLNKPHPPFSLPPELRKCSLIR